MESKLLSAACGSRSAYEQIRSVQDKTTFSDKSKAVLDEIGKYYEADPDAGSVDKEVLSSRLARAYPKHDELFRTIVGSLEPVSIPNIMAEVLNLRKENIKQKIAAAAAAGIDNDEEIFNLVEELDSIKAKQNPEQVDTIYNNTSAAEVVQKTTGKELIKLLPTDLNKALGGGVLRKQHIVVFARPDVGKTTFAINLAKGFLKQGLRTLYIANEDPAHHILKRMMSLITGMTQEEINSRPDEVDAKLAARNWDKFTLVELAPGTPGEIRQLVEAHTPDVLIVDQARNLDMRDTNRVTQLEKACTFVRQIGKKHNMVTISFVQAGDSAEGKLVLNMGDVDFSNTGIPSTADLMVGIGCNTDYELAGQRMLSFPKNKVNGNKEPIQVPIEFKTFRMG